MAGELYTESTHAKDHSGVHKSVDSDSILNLMAIIITLQFLGILRIILL